MILDALKLSILVAGMATIVVTCLGGLTGFWLARHRFPGRGLVDSLLNLPLVLPPTVTGYYLIVLLGRRGLLGEPLHATTGWSIPFTWVACATAAAVMAFPLMARAARVAFEEIDPRHELVAASLGHGPLAIFFRVQVPLARRGLTAGGVLAFARALGEFGATLILAGNVPGKTQTLPLLIYEAVMIGEDRTALVASALLTAVSVLVMLIAGQLERETAMSLEVDIGLERRGLGGSLFRLEARFEAGAGITVVCGPSGAGKSSLLLGLLGAIVPSAGRIRLATTTLFDAEAGIDRPVRERRMGMVFQGAALFPHLDVKQNVGFGLSGANRSARTRALLERVGAGELSLRRPSELSGGETQRVALARALAAEPRALLLDEPFSAIDAAARESLGRLLLDLQETHPIPFLHVTHDLGEALRLGRRLVLLDGGRVVQIGPPAEVIARPTSLAAAGAVGTENLFNGRVLRHHAEHGYSEVEIGGTIVQSALLDLAPDDRLTLVLRAEDILLSLTPIHATSARNVLEGEIREIAPRGNAVELRVTTPVSFRVMVTAGSVRDLALAPGLRVYLLIKATAFHRLD